MSLVQHVTAVEGIDREVEPDLQSLFDRDAETESLSFGVPLGRRLSLTLSYDPIPNYSLPTQPTEKLQSVGAYEVTQGKRIGTCFQQAPLRRTMCLIPGKHRLLSASFRAC